MKKIFITMLVAAVATASFAQGNPKIAKEVKATKDYLAGKALLDGQLESLTDEQKGDGYNALVEIVYPKASAAFDTYQTNQVSGNTAPVDFSPVYQAIDEAMKADQFNQKYHKKNQDRLQVLRVPLIIAGQDYLKANDYPNALTYMALYVNSSKSSLFKEVADDKDANLGSVARLCAALCYQQENYADGIKYGKIAMATDSTSRADAEPYYIACIEKGLKTKQDTIDYIQELNTIDSKKYFARCMSLYNAIGEAEKANKLLDEEIARNPNNKMAYAVKGENAMTNRDYDTAIANFKKVVEIDPAFTAVWFNLGVCISQKGFDLNEKYSVNGRIANDKAQEVNTVLKDAIAAYEKVRELDPNHEQIPNWPVQLRMLYNAVGDTAKAQEITQMLGDN